MKVLTDSIFTDGHINTEDEVLSIHVRYVGLWHDLQHAHLFTRDVDSLVRDTDRSGHQRHPVLIGVRGLLVQPDRLQVTVQDLDGHHCSMAVGLTRLVDVDDDVGFVISILPEIDPVSAWTYVRDVMYVISWVVIGDEVVGDQRRVVHDPFGVLSGGADV